MRNFIDFIKENRTKKDIVAEQDSKLQKEYDAFFAKMLKKYGVEDAGDLNDEDSKKFFDEIEKNWIEGKGEKK